MPEFLISVLRKSNRGKTDSLAAIEDVFKNCTYFYFGLTVQLAGSLFPSQELNLGHCSDNLES